ncbi:MAG: hypothetical protein KJO21_07940 [Verrucomicrobiae bacterium]|nr:hypothetical protein [Verrucomicrobiae bacterium]NNJ43404.1 hypothetical protein [Akkermansiaceae bacterium]
MTKLQDISEIPSEAVDLLEAVGYLDVEEFYETNAQELLAEIVKANHQLAIMPHDPTEENVEAWKMAVSARGAYQGVGESTPKHESRDEEAPDIRNNNESVGADRAQREKEESEEDQSHLFDVDPNLVNFEEDPEVQAMLVNAPEAEPLRSTLIRRHNIAVDDIPEGILLTQCSGEVEMNVLSTPRLANLKNREADAGRTGLMVSRIRHFDEADDEDHHIKPLDKGASKEAVSVSQGVNHGLTPESRRFVRGVLHPEPFRVRVAAFFAMLVQLLLVANLIGMPWLILYGSINEKNMLWPIVGLSSGLFLSALAYLFWGVSARCRVCGQRQFAPKKCLKNRKAHHIPLIGYILPTALHAMFFKWFYCTYCGTAVRLKR